MQQEEGKSMEICYILPDFVSFALRQSCKYMHHPFLFENYILFSIKHLKVWIHCMYSALLLIWAFVYVLNRASASGDIHLEKKYTEKEQYQYLK